MFPDTPLWVGPTVRTSNSHIKKRRKGLGAWKRFIRTVALTFYNYCFKGRNIEVIPLVTKSIITMYELRTSGRGVILSYDTRDLGSNPGTTHDPMLDF